MTACLDTPQAREALAEVIAVLARALEDQEAEAA